MRKHKERLLYLVIGGILIALLLTLLFVIGRKADESQQGMVDYIPSTQTSWNSDIEVHKTNRDNSIDKTEHMDGTNTGENWVQSEATMDANVEQLPEKWQEGVISYNGKSYRYNSAIKTYLFLGIDTDDPVYAMDVSKTGYQSDAMFLLIADSKTKQLSVIGIHRNTMAEIVTYTASGAKIIPVETQICLQHAYGDGKKISCERTVTAVSKLFDNLPIDGYLSLNVGGVPALNDSIGGVNVTILQDITDEEQGVTLTKGEVKNLSGKEAYCYLRRRDITEFDSATDRLLRQQQYLNAFLSKLKTSEDQENMVTNLLEQTQDYIVSDLDLPTVMSNLMTYEYTDDSYYMLPGETIMGDDGYEEYIIDDEQFTDLLIRTFYREVSNF